MGEGKEMSPTRSNMSMYSDVSKGDFENNEKLKRDHGGDGESGDEEINKNTK